MIIFFSTIIIAMTSHQQMAPKNKIEIEGPRRTRGTFWFLLSRSHSQYLYCHFKCESWKVVNVCLCGKYDDDLVLGKLNCYSKYVSTINIYCLCGCVLEEAKIYSSHERQFSSMILILCVLNEVTHKSDMMEFMLCHPQYNPDIFSTSTHPPSSSLLTNFF